MTAQEWNLIFDLVGLFVAGGIGIGFVAACAAAVSQ